MPESNPMVPKPLADQQETPEDVATLYSWANLHGAKYRDFSASRAEAREEARLRVEKVQAEERRKQEEEAELVRQEEAQVAARQAAEAAEAARQAEADRLADIARQAEAERQAVLAAQEAQRQSAWQRSRQPIHDQDLEAGYSPSFDSGVMPQRPASERGMSERVTPERAMPETDPRNFNPAQAAGYSEGRGIEGRAEQGRFTRRRQTPGPVQYAAEFAHESPQGYVPPVNPMAQPGAGYRAPNMNTAPEFGEGYPAQGFAPPAWHQPEVREQSTRPAWLAAELPPVARPQEYANPQSGMGGGWGSGAYQAGNPGGNPSANPGPAAPSSYPVPAPPMYGNPQAGPVSGQPQFPWQMSQNPPNNAPQNPNANPGSNPNQNQGGVDETLVGSRDRMTNRWYALKNVFDPQAAPAEQVPAQPPARVPVLAVFSLAGGVGKTSLVASLGRALSARGERVLLVDTAAYGVLPFFFGARDHRPGMLRTFTPPGASNEAPIQLVTLDPEGQPQEFHTGAGPRMQDDTSLTSPHATGQDFSAARMSGDWLAQEVNRYSRGANRIVIDLPTASGSTTRRVLRMSPVVLVPVVPDMNSVVSVGAIEGFFRNNASMAGAGMGSGMQSAKPIMPFYVLNQFDHSLPLHLDVREILQEQIGDRLLPFALRRSPAVSEALAEGMTVIDYAPNAVVAEDYANLAGWVRSLSAPASQTYRGVRWSER